MKLCRLCGAERTLVNAHAIPEAFFREVRVGPASPILVSAEEGQFPRKSPIGVYDNGILCEVCEPKFGSIDDYGINVLLKDFRKYFRPVVDGERLAGFESTTVDPERLLQFLVAVLWRASVSTHDFYENVDLGPYHTHARSAIASRDAEVSSVFDAVLSRWKDPDRTLPPTVILDPRRERWGSVNAVNGYRLYLGESVAYIKVDAQPFPPELRARSLRSAPPVLVVARSMAHSRDLQVMKDTALRSHQNKQKLENKKRGNNGAA